MSYKKLPKEVQHFIRDRGLENAIRTVQKKPKKGVWLVEHDELKGDNTDKHPMVNYDQFGANLRANGYIKALETGNHNGGSFVIAREEIKGIDMNTDSQRLSGERSREVTLKKQRDLLS